MKPEVIPQIDRATSTFSYVVIDPVTGATALVDSILDFDPKSGRISTASADRMVTLMRERGLNPETRAFTGHDHKAPGRQDDAWESTGPGWDGAWIAPRVTIEITIKEKAHAARNSFAR